MYLTSDGQKILMLTCVTAKSHLLCKFRQITNYMYVIIMYMHAYYRRIKKDHKRSLFSICPKPREKQCANKHFAIADRLLRPKVSHEGMSDIYICT